MNLLNNMEINKQKGARNTVRLLRAGQLYNIFLIIATIVVATNIAGCANLRWRMKAIQRLIELSKNQKYKEEVLKQETTNFKRLKEYILNDEIKKGIPKDMVIDKVGEPILIFDETEGEKWIYKAADSNWFGGEKIYLFFAKEDRLINWECVNMEYSAFVK